jgi:hypothetical protein
LEKILWLLTICEMQEQKFKAKRATELFWS